MTTIAAKSAYLGWLAATLATERGASRTFAAAPDDLVLGYATRYDAADIAPFVRSLRSVFDGPVVLVVDDRADVRRLLDANDITAVHPQAMDGWAPHPVMARFAAFAGLIEQRPWARDVFITDVRDVVFQAPPFQPAPKGLELFVEMEAGTLGDHAFNMKYLRALVGDAMAAYLSERPCVCVGTIMGPSDAVLRFCRTLLMLAAIPRSEIGGAFGADQAACNLAVHLGLVEADIRANYGRVATLGLTEGASLTVRDGHIVNPDGTISAIVHQHDRHPHLGEAVHALWGDGFSRRERETSASSIEKGRKLRSSVLRRLPEFR